MQKFALSYTGHPFTPNGQLNAWDYQMEPEIRALECKFANCTHYHRHTKSKIRNPAKPNQLNSSFNWPFSDALRRYNDPIISLSLISFPHLLANWLSSPFQATSPGYCFFLNPLGGGGGPPPLKTWIVQWTLIILIILYPIPSFKSN